MLREIKLIIFDLDGTLVNAYDAIVSSFNYTMCRLDLPIRSYQTIKKAVGWGDRGLLCPFVPERKLTKALKIYQAHHKKALLHKTRLLPGALATLKYLHSQGYKLAVASNRPRLFTKIVIQNFRLEQFFDYVLCGDQLSRPKPHKDILLKVMRRFSAKKREALYVGDMTIDIKTGRNAGVRAIAVTTGSNSRKELLQLKPFKLLKDIRGLVKIL